MQLYLYAKDDLVLREMNLTISEYLQNENVSLLDVLPMIVQMDHVLLSERECKMCKSVAVERCFPQGRILILYLSSDIIDRGALTKFMLDLLAVTNSCAVTGCLVS